MKYGTVFKLVAVFSLFVLIAALPVASYAINVTVRFNSATVMDTLSEDDFVQIRGDINGTEGALPDGNQLTWSNTSDLVMQNVGGDYWELTFQVNTGDVINYKFWTGFDANTGTGVVWDGWEGPINDPDGQEGDNRAFVAGAQDTVLALQYYNTTSSTVDQYYRPFEEVEGSVAFYFRVNMAGLEDLEEFDPEVDIPVTVRGSAPLDPEDDWSPAIVELEREATDGTGQSFWSGVAYAAIEDLSSDQFQNYKFVFTPNGTGEAWENIDNRWFGFSPQLAEGAYDTTLHWEYFNNQAPGGEIVEATVNWLMDPGALEELGFFDPSLGDQILISGPLGWTIPDDAIEVVYQPLLEMWIGQHTFNALVGDFFSYKYVILYDSTRLDEEDPAYIPGLPGTELWEEPGVTGGSNRSYTFTADAEQQPEGDFGRTFQFYNSVPPEGVIPLDISVTFNVNMEPATDPEINTTNPLFRPGVDTCYIYFESPLFMLTQGLPAYEHTLEMTDLDGDGVYSATMDLVAPTVYQVGFRVGYTADGDDVVNGGGVEFGRRYYQYVVPTYHNPGVETIWPEDWEFNTVNWSPFDLTVENPPDFSQEFDVAESGPVPEDFRVLKAYPNPFNPSTTIEFAIPHAEKVNVSIYNVLGQHVRTLVDGDKQAGTHRVHWDAHDSSDNPLASGVYFMRLTSPERTMMKKIVLLR